MRVFCLDWDSPDTQSLREGIAEGWLPNVANLLARGVAAMIVDTQEILTPASWPTLIRGTSPASHGQVADRELVPSTYRWAPVRADRGEDPPFWRLIGDAGLRSTIASVYGSPLLVNLPGTQIVGWGSHDPYTTRAQRPRCSPPGIIAELERIVGRRAIRYGLKLPRTAAGAEAYLDRTLRGIEQQGRALAHLIEHTEWDFFFGSIAEGHEAGHVLWSYHDPTHRFHDPDAPLRLRRSLKQIYAAIDRELGRLLELLRDDDAVLVVTPYGLGPNQYLEGLGDEILQAGGLLRKLPGDRPAPDDYRLRALARARRAVHRIVPARLRPALGRLVPRDRLVNSLVYVDVDWSATRAFALWGDGSTLLRVNLEDREPAGIVPADSYESVRDELIELFSGLAAADTGEPLVSRVVRFEEVGGGDVRGGFPDICVQWARERRPRCIHSPQFGELPLDPITGGPLDVDAGRPSIHWTNGFLIGAGPGLPATAQGRLDGPAIRLVDFAPTVLALLGVDAGSLDGSPAWPAGTRPELARP